MINLIIPKRESKQMIKQKRGLSLILAIVILATCTFQPNQVVAAATTTNNIKIYNFI